jgi:hypothetical protein
MGEGLGFLSLFGAKLRVLYYKPFSDNAEMLIG